MLKAIVASAIAAAVIAPIVTANEFPTAMLKVKELYVATETTEEFSTVTPLKGQDIEGCLTELLLDVDGDVLVPVFLDARRHGSTVSVKYDDPLPETDDNSCFIRAASPGKSGIPE